MLVKKVKFFENTDLLYLNAKVNSWIVDETKNNEIVNIIKIYHDSTYNDRLGAIRHFITVVYTTKINLKKKGIFYAN